MMRFFQSTSRLHAAASSVNKLSWREVFLPPRSSTQEKFLLSWCAAAPDKLVVMHAFRGCRKTTSANRLVRRHEWGIPVTWPYVYLQLVCVSDMAELEAALGVSLDSTRPPAAAVVSNRLMSLILTSLAVFAVGVLLIFMKDGTISIELASQHLKCPDQAEQIVWAIATCLAVMYCFRRKVLIVDDILNFQYGNAMKKTNAVQCTLDILKQLPLSRHPIIVLSSNEGIGRLFSDKNWTTFHEATFPAAEPAELADVLRRTVVPNMTLDHFNKVKDMHGMFHHLYSVRWWRSVSKRDADIRSLLSGDPHIDRATLHEIALALDLECQSVARWYALAYSVEVDVGDALKMYFDANEIASIIRLYGAKGPRRLVLAAGLLVTGKEAARRQQLAIEIAQKIAAQEAAVAVATANIEEIPSDEASQVLAAEKKKLESLRAYAAQHAPMLPSPTDIAEFKFSCAVRRCVGCVDEECFKKDETCIEEIGRIERLL